MARIIEGVAIVAGTLLLNLIPVVGTFFDTAFGEAIFSTALSIGVSLTLAGIANALQAGPSLPFSIRQSAAPRVCVYGQCRVAGALIFDASGEGAQS